MNRQKYLRIVNVIIFLLVVGLAFSGITRKFFPTLVPYTTFTALHPLTGFLFLFFLTLHIILNFNWIKANYFKRKKT